MKPILVFLSLFCALSAQTQVLTHLQNLEGTWYRDDRREACYARWQFADDHMLLGRTFGLRCGDTLLYSTATIKATETGATMTLHIDSLGQRQTQTFRLVHSTKDELFWENEDAEGFPRRLGWIFYSSGYASFRADGVETDYRRKFEWTPKTIFGLSVGANTSTLVRPLDNPSDQLHYQAQAGSEIALSIGLRSPDNPIACHVEIGMTRWRTQVNGTFQVQQVQYGRAGVYERTNFYLALVPEVSFGRNRAFSIAPGFFLDLAYRHDFQGEITVAGNGSPESPYTDPGHDIGPERGFLLGAAWRLPWARLSALQPALYARGSFGLYSDEHVRALSVGLRFRVED